MKLHGTISIHVAGEQLMRQPGWLDRVRRTFGGQPDLATGRMRASLEATTVVDAVRHALASLGITDAVSLVVDDLVVFQDRDRRGDDLGDLFLAFHDSAAVIGSGFDVLRLAVEHVDAGLHYVIEVQARTEHAEAEAAVRVIASARIAAFAAQAGEDAASYRARVEPLLADRVTVELARVAFDSFVATLRDTLARAMPEARAELGAAELRLQRPEPEGRRQREPGPDEAGYDPHAAYYPSPMAGVLGMMAWSSLGMMMMPNVTVVDASNQPVEASPAADDGPAPGDAPAEAGGVDDGGGFGDVDW